MGEHKQAVVVGALGVIGRYIVERLLRQDDWSVIGLSRRAVGTVPRYRHISVDLLDREDAAAKLAGNSLALRVPKAFADEIGASEGKAAEMTVSNGKLVIEIARSQRRKRRYKLEELVAGITPDNRHEEIDWGPPVGNEVW
jgi:antitoxin MazE